MLEPGRLLRDAALGALVAVLLAWAFGGRDWAVGVALSSALALVNTVGLGRQVTRLLDPEAAGNRLWLLFASATRLGLICLGLVVLFRFVPVPAVLVGIAVVPATLTLRASAQALVDRATPQEAL